MSGVDRAERLNALKHLVELLERSIASDEEELARGWKPYRKDITPQPTVPVELHPLHQRLEAKRRYLKKFRQELYGALEDRSEG